MSFFATVVAAVTFCACAARQPGDPVEPGFNLFSKQQDIQLGQEAAAEIRKQVDIVENRELQAYVAELGRRLASQPQAEDYPYSFTLVNEDNINAFALPGGPIFVHSGLIEAAANEGQVVGVLAHEIGHVALRHATNQASKANLIQLPAILAGAAIGQESVLAQLGQVGLGLGVNSVLLKYSRDAERQADAFGARLMAQAGYNPVEMARFFETLAAEGGSRAPEFLSSHPDPGNRVEAVRAEIPALPQGEYAANTGRFPQMKQVVAGLPAPARRPETATAAAATSAPGPPSAEFRQLETNAFQLAYPGNWQVRGDRSSSVLTIAPNQGLVQDRSGRISIGYGAVLSYYKPQPQARTLGQATQELVSQLTYVNPDLRAAGRRQVRVDGKPGLLTMFAGASPYGGAETSYLLTVAQPQGLFYMVFIGPRNQFNQLAGTFDRMLQSLRLAG
jgi:Zn-dependent protease with chaperone function